MSHEIRSPMNAIIGMTALALDGTDPEEQRDYLRTVQSSSRALLAIIDDILDFSKIEEGKLVLDSVAFDPATLLGEVVRMLAPGAREKGLELACDLEPGLPAQVSGDPGRLRQVVLNRLGNAIKFTGRGEVVLRTLDRRRGRRRAARDPGVQHRPRPGGQPAAGDADGRHARRRVPIIGLTANAMTSDRDACLAAGMDDWAPKPIQPERLQEAMRRATRAVAG